MIACGILKFSFQVRRFNLACLNLAYIDVEIPQSIAILKSFVQQHVSY